MGGRPSSFARQPDVLSKSAGETLHGAHMIGGMRFPSRSAPPPGPLALLASQLKQEPPPLSAAVRRLLEALPPRLSTQVLQREHPALLERVARASDSARELRLLTDEWMFSGGDRRSRLGFAAIVELTELKGYLLATRCRTRHSVWDHALGLV